MAEASPRFKAGVTGLFYLVTVLTGGAVLFAHGKLGFVFDLIAAACYIGVSALFYELSR
jgi:hypothetical protein